MGADLILSYLPVKTTVVELRQEIIESINALTDEDCEEIMYRLADFGLICQEECLVQNPENTEEDVVSATAVRQLLLSCADKVDENIRTNATMLVEGNLIIITGGESWGEAPGNVDSFEILSIAKVVD